LGRGQLLGCHSERRFFLRSRKNDAKNPLKVGQKCLLLELSVENAVFTIYVFAQTLVLGHNDFGLLPSVQQ
jgi:hypothetical protein